VGVTTSSLAKRPVVILGSPAIYRHCYAISYKEYHTSEKDIKCKGHKESKEILFWSLVIRERGEVGFLLHFRKKIVFSS